MKQNLLEIFLNSQHKLFSLVRFPDTMILVHDDINYKFKFILIKNISNILWP